MEMQCRIWKRSAIFEYLQFPNRSLEIRMFFSAEERQHVCDEKSSRISDQEMRRPSHVNRPVLFQTTGAKGTYSTEDVCVSFCAFSLQHRSLSSPSLHPSAPRDPIPVLLIPRFHCFDPTNRVQQWGV